MRGAMILLAAIAVALVGMTGLLASPAYAHDHRIPKTVLLQGKQELQTGRKVHEYIWTYPSNGNTCVAEQAVLDFGFPRVDSVAAGRELKIRIHKAHRPTSFDLLKVDRNGTIKREHDFRLRPVVKDGRTVAWDAVFRLNRPDTNYRLLTEGHWRDREGCRADQFAQWTFHVKTRP